MTFSKKLALIFTCALGMQSICQAYDAVGLKAEVAQILDFIKELDKHDTNEACTVAGWLERNLIAQYTDYLTNLDIIAIAKTVTTNITLDAKLTVISRIMLEKAEEAQRAAEQNVVWEKENAKQQLKWAEDQAKCEAQWAKKAAESDKKAIKSKVNQEKKFLIEEAQKGIKRSFWNGVLNTILAAECAMIVALVIDFAVRRHDATVFEKVAEMIADAFDREHAKKTVKKVLK